ncbi:5-formyltetrahydrofolate cyclo-ligase [Sulfuriflexus mobilis]|uniref:5-formyltetrahydrofolate cyclo-ligase n=1 Tax=Sulfuriflexus mobilis TaxID=1811807 RepID=UPI000F81980E|nr:5-formyltetrahydrofolate cyclo-ligase [Sulfuriflexus mobilis]
MSQHLNTPALRKQMRSQRRALSAREHRQASDRALDLILRHPLFMRAQHIALFLPNDGEIDISELMPTAWSMHKRCYLPVLASPGQRLVFAPMTQDSRLELNRYGIPEPVASRHQIRQPRQLDLVLTPLVAFDAAGNRIGMGGGYYDRSFAFLRRRRHWRHPHLLGVAHDFQRLEALPQQAWDVPLQGVFTDRKFYPAT